MNSSRQPEAPVVTSHLRVGENGLGFYHYKIIQKVFISNDLDGTEDDVLLDEQHVKSDSDEEGNEIYDDMMTHKQIQQMFIQDSDDDEFLGFE